MQGKTFNYKNYPANIRYFNMQGTIWWPYKSSRPEETYPTSVAL